MSAPHPDSAWPPLRVAALQAQLQQALAHGASLPADVRVLSVASSSQDALRTLAAQGAPAGSVVWVGHQTAGRGRQGRVWTDRGGEAPQAALFSVLVKPDQGWRDLPRTALTAGLAVVQGLGRLGLQDLWLKWPNDVLDARGSKVAGVLCEVVSEPHAPPAVAVGIGINLRPVSPTGWIDRPATAGQSARRNAVSSVAEVALAADLDAPTALQVVSHVVRSLREGMTQSPESILDAWRRRSATLGRQVQIGDVAGVAVDLDAGGGLLVRDAHGVVRRVLTGDVEHGHRAESR